jgi:anti-sigma factor (TIGR02949 family)
MDDIKPISCQEALKLIFDYIDEELHEHSKTELEKHLEACRHCFDRVEFEKMLKARLRRLNTEEMPPETARRFLQLLDEF